MTEQELREAARRIAFESAEAQGLPRHVEDPILLAMVVRFIDDGLALIQARAAAERRPA